MTSSLPEPPVLAPCPPGPVPMLPPRWHAVALCTPFAADPVAVVEVWCDTELGAIRLRTCGLDGDGLDLLFAPDGRAWLLFTDDADRRVASMGPVATTLAAPAREVFAGFELACRGRHEMLGAACDWWVGLTGCTNGDAPGLPTAPVGQVANWFWFHEPAPDRPAEALPWSMMFLNAANPYGLPVLGDFAFIVLPTFEPGTDGLDLGALMVACEAGSLPAPASLRVDTPAQRLAAEAVWPEAAGHRASRSDHRARHLVPGLRRPDARDTLPAWPERFHLTSFSLPTFDTLPNAPYPTAVWYEAKAGHMLTRMRRQDGSLEDCILDDRQTHLVFRQPDGTHACGPVLPVGLPRTDWMQTDGGRIAAVIEGHPRLGRGSPLLMVSLPSDAGRVFWATYRQDGRPVTFLESPQCCNVQLVLTLYDTFTTAPPAFDDALFAVPADCLALTSAVPLRPLPR
jgi:hypothetical protein